MTATTDSELGALADLAAEGFGGAVARVEELHQAIARRTVGGPARAAHDAIAAGVYALVRGGGRALGRGMATAARSSGVGGRVLSDHPRGRLARGALNGVWGDRLHGGGSALAMAMDARVLGDPTPFPVVLVHGLCESDAAWSIRARRHGGTYMSRVLEPLGATPVMISYNTGRGIEENGVALAELLDALVADWPGGEIERLALIGHSMGGLVLRAAAVHGGAWTDRVDATVSLGTPHRGAPLAQAAVLADRALALVPESRAVGAVLEARSAGIKDLARGLASEEALPGARHLAVAATVTTDHGHLLGRLAGDLLVLKASAHGSEAEHVHVGAHDHFDLLNSPALDDVLRRCLDGPRSER